MLNGNEMKAFYRIFFPKRPGEGGLAARVPDVNETRLNDNFKIIGDEFRKIWEFIKNGFKTKSLTVDGDASIGGDASVVGQLSAGSAALGDTNVNGALDVDGSATFDSGVTIGGVLSVTNRRAYKDLSSAGWYRVMTVTTQGSAGYSWAANINITRAYNNTNNEVHSIKLLACYNSFAFADETSKTNAVAIDKIRYVKNTDSPTIGYVDIHYNVAVRNGVCVAFDVKAYPTLQRYFVANDFDSIADSPSGETVVTEYSFAANTNIDKTEFTPTNATAYSSYGNCYYERKGSIVHVHIGVSGLTANSTTIIASLPTAIIPSTKILSSGMGGSFTLGAICRIETDGSVQVCSEGTYALCDFVYMV